ncbi:hypothetical protein CASFOL_031228 [Castilleja foliolosa]|uniref:U-box domain-containing protein n=1 Tax=Castilleja foliolosa TaxID=1961234 RepID=A0ABD3C440_9LAMI
MEKNNFPEDFMCPISMELMKDPVTILTGVTYDRKNIEKWFKSYNKKTCPATMQPVETLATTPNHTLKRLIDAWLVSQSMHDDEKPSTPTELANILVDIKTTPFKASCLRKLRSTMGTAGDDVMLGFKKAGGVEMLVNMIVCQTELCWNYDFAPMRVCEEALGVLHMILNSDDDDDELIVERLMRNDCVRSMAVILQRGSSEARFYAISIFRKMSKGDYLWSCVAHEQGVEFFKSLLETVSDEICTKTSSCALQLLIQILEASKKSRLKAIDAGAISSLVELLPDSNRSRCEKILQLIKLMCECADGRLAFTEHGLGIAAVSNKMLSVSNGATRIVVKILWLVSSFHPTDRVLEEMLVFGAMEKMVALLHVGGGGGGGSMKDRVVKMLKLHGGVWRRYPCFPGELKNCLG